MSCSDPPGSMVDGYAAAEALDWFLSQLQSEESASQCGTPPSRAPLNPESMDVHHPPLAQQPGTSQPSNITNAAAAAAAKREKIRESKNKSREKKEKERRENAEKVVELAKQIHDLREVNAGLEKEVVEAKIKQKKGEQELSNCKEEVSRLKNELEGQTMQKRKLRHSKLKRRIKRLKTDVVEINEGQERIRAGQKEVREKFEEINKEAAKLKEEIYIISKQSANQVRPDHMFQIVKARSEDDAPKDAALTQFLRALINGTHNMIA